MGTIGAPVVLVFLPVLAPGVNLSVVGCTTGIVVVFGDPGLPLCHSVFNCESSQPLPDVCSQPAGKTVFS